MKRKKQPKGLFEQIAAQEGGSPAEVERELQKAIDATWDNPDPAARAERERLFPNGKPPIAEFIRVMAAQVKK